MSSLKKVVAQLIITDISSPYVREYDHEYCRLIFDYNIGGIMLFNGLNINGFPIRLENQLVEENQTKSLIKKLKSYNPKLLVAVDVEGGLVDRLHYIRKRSYNSAKIIGELVKDGKDFEWLSGLFNLRGQYLRSLGFNMNAAPALDVVPSYKDKYLMAYQKRSFGSNADLVSKAGLACIKGMQDAKIIPVAKHFPGLGPVAKGFDPHFDFPEIKKVNKKSLKPFFDAVDNGVEVIMTTHLKVKKYGSEIATVNKDVLDILRNYGFDGVIITDCISMMSTGMLNRHRNQGPTKENIESIVNTAYDAVKAGHDMILVRQLGCVNKQETDFIKMIINKIEKGVLNKDISEKQIMKSYEKVLKLKEVYC